MTGKRKATNVYLDDDIKTAVIAWAARNRLSMSAAINIMCTSPRHAVMVNDITAGIRECEVASD